MSFEQPPQYSEGSQESVLKRQHEAWQRSQYALTMLGSAASLMLVDKLFLEATGINTGNAGTAAVTIGSTMFAHWWVYMRGKNKNENQP